MSAAKAIKQAFRVPEDRTKSYKVLVKANIEKARRLYDAGLPDAAASVS